MKRLFKWFSRKCEHDWVYVVSYFHKENETEIVSYNWCLKCNKIQLKNSLTRPIEE
jgi:hypothetical protein